MTATLDHGTSHSDECPFCTEASLTYQFRSDHATYRVCRVCGMLIADAQFRSLGPPVPEATLSDVNSYAFELARRYLGRPLRQSIVVRADSDALAEGGRFDAIVVNGALERSADPQALLERLAHHLERGGALVLLAASTGSPNARSQRNKWRELASGATYFFSPDTLQLLATRAGFGDFYLSSEPDATSAAGPTVAAWFRSHMAVVCAPVERPNARLLSVVMPVYNEAPTFERSLQRVLDKRIEGIEIEVVVVENNSTDGTKALVERYRDEPRVLVVSLDRARGKGYAVRAGLRHVRGDVVLVQDADLEYDVEDYDRLVEPLFALRRNFVLGTRHDAAGVNWKVRYFDSEPALTNVLNFGHVALTTMFNVLYNARLCDPFTMYKVFRRDCLYGLTFESERFDFDLELVIKFVRKGYRVLEVPVNYRSRPFREGKKIKPFRDPIDWIVAMLKFRRSPLVRFHGGDVYGRSEGPHLL